MKCPFFIRISGIWILAAGFSHAILDSNNNGLSDFWERDFNNGNVFDEFFDPQADSDADGWTNAQEAAAGTNPFDPNPPDGLIQPSTAHVPAVLGEENGVPVVISPEAITVSWPTITGKKYTLRFSTDLTQGSWVSVGNPFIANGSEVTYNFTISQADKCFWRVEVTDVDTDGDGLTDHEEPQFGTNPASPMTFPGIPDAWLAANFPSAQGFDPYGDPDGDGLNNALENQLGLDPNHFDKIGPVNLGFDEEITDAPDMSFRETIFPYPSDLYDQTSIPGWNVNADEETGGWQAGTGQHIEIWDEGDGNPYAELQAHLDAHGLKQEFNMLPGSRYTFILRYKGRYDYDAYDNAFDLEVEGASELLVDGSPATAQGTTRSHSFMDDDEWEAYADWHYATVSITAETDTAGLKKITLSLVPKTTTTYGENGQEEITYGGFVDLIPVEIRRDEEGDLVTWDTINGNMAKALPGQRINLKPDLSKLPSSLEISNKIWIIQGETFLNYTATGANADVTPLTSTEYKNEEIHFYWANSGVRDVHFDFSINGHPARISTKINVIKPNSSLTATIGGVAVTSSGIEPVGGIDFKGKVDSILNEFNSEGEWQYTQTITDRAYAKFAGGEKFVGNNYGTAVLDTAFPYYPDNGTFFNTGAPADETDNPTLFLTGNATEMGVDNDFEMYLMFRPPGINAKWVPLRVIIWNYKGKATRSGSTWSAITGSLGQITDSPGTETHIHPEWNANYDPFSWIQRPNN